MSEFANVSYHSLQNLSNGLSDAQGRLHTVQAEIDIKIDHTFQGFYRARDILQDRLNKAENALASAEMKLAEMESRQRWVEDKDGYGGRWVPDTSAQRVKVQACRDHRDRCRQKLIECSSIIERCKHARKFLQGSYSVIDRSFVTSIKDLQTDLANVAAYQGHSSHSMRASFSAGTQKVKDKASSSEDFTTKEKVVRLRFYDKNGNPLTNANIQIIDNQVFGFSVAPLETDENGYVTMPYAISDDCSIFVNDEEVYKGKLFESMEYNRNADGKMDTRPTENKTDNEQQ